MNTTPTGHIGVPEINEEMSEETLRAIEQRAREDMEKIQSLGAIDEKTKQALFIPYRKIQQEIAFVRQQREKVMAISALKAHLKTVTGMSQETKKRVRHALGAILTEGDVSLEVRRGRVVTTNLSQDTLERLIAIKIETIGDLLEASEKIWGKLRQQYNNDMSRGNGMTYSGALIEIANMLTRLGVNKNTVMVMLQRAALANIMLNDWIGGREEDDSNDEDDEIPDGLGERKLYGNEDPELDLGVESRIQKILIREGIDTVQKALDMKSEDWEKIKGLGYLSRNTIANDLMELGVPRKMLGDIRGEVFRMRP